MSSSDENLYRGDPPSAPPPPPPTTPGQAPPGYGQSGYAAPGYPPPGYSQPGYAPGYPPPGYAPPGYAPPGYAPSGYAPVRPTNTMAILALVFAFLFPPAGIVLGVLARRQIRETGEQGDGLALAGIIVGGIFTALYALVFIGLIAAFSAATSYGY